MHERTFFEGLIVSWFILAVLVSILLRFISAPYGRHTRQGWGPNLPSWVGWLIMEAPASLIFLVYFFISPKKNQIVPIIFLLLWMTHYFHRSFVYPFSLRGSARRMPVVVVAMGMVFNIGNTYINGRYLFMFSENYTIHWLYDPRFIVGVVMFTVGYIINKNADRTLRLLRKPGETGYKVPHGGLYRWISCPNYFGEIIEWFGWALATWSLAGLSFAIWTAANLGPRALTHHQWYQEEFPEYPPERKAIVPFIL